MNKNAVLVIAIACAVAVLDGVFKFFAIHSLPPDTLPVAFPLDFALHKNPGITFDIAVPLSLLIPFTAVIISFLIAFSWKNRRHNTSASLAALIVTFGATGNLIDRAINGFTTDYIILFGRSAINLADVLIITGAVFLLYYTRHNTPVTGET